jgi:hypothetical protein
MSDIVKYGYVMSRRVLPCRVILRVVLSYVMLFLVPFHVICIMLFPVMLCYIMLRNNENTIALCCVFLRGPNDSKSNALFVFILCRDLNQRSQGQNVDAIALHAVRLFAKSHRFMFRFAGYDIHGVISTEWFLAQCRYVSFCRLRYPRSGSWLNVYSPDERGHDRRSILPKE